MTIFLIGFIVLCELSVLFFVGCFSLIYYWHETKTTLVILPTLFTFYFFLIGFIMLCVAFVLLQFSPDILRLINSAF